MDKPKRTIWSERRQKTVKWLRRRDWTGFFILGFIAILITAFFVWASTLKTLAETQSEIIEVYHMCMVGKEDHAYCVEWTLEQVD